MITENISEDYHIIIDILSFPVFEFVSVMQLRILVILFLLFKLLFNSVKI